MKDTSLYTYLFICAHIFTLVGGFAFQLKPALHYTNTVIWFQNCTKIINISITSICTIPLRSKEKVISPWQKHNKI